MPPTKLDNLLDSIHPSRVIDLVARRANKVLTEFSVPATVGSQDALLDVLVRLHRRCFYEMLRLSGDFPKASPEFEQSMCREVLNKAFGSSGFRTSADIAITGAEGALPRVVREFVTVLSSQFTKNEIASRVCFYWKDLTDEERFAAPDEYLEKYKSVIHPGYEWNIRANFRDWLLKHPMMIQNLERIGRNL